MKTRFYHTRIISLDDVPTHPSFPLFLPPLPYYVHSRRNAQRQVNDDRKHPVGKQSLKRQIVSDLMHDKGQEVVAGTGEGVGEEEEEGERGITEDDSGQDLKEREKDGGS